jgi:hypothetical protein
VDGGEKEMKKREIPKDYYSNDRSRYGNNYAIFYGDTKMVVELKIKKYFDNWPPEGYSTYVAIKPT